MHLLASASAFIQCPQARAFAYVADLGNFPRWFPGVLEVRPADTLPPACVGKRYEETFLTPLRRRKAVVIRVAQADPPRRIATEGALPGLLPRMEIEVRAAGPQACEVHWRMGSRNPARIARWTWLPLTGLALQGRADAAMPRLKKMLEAAAR